MPTHKPMKPPLKYHGGKQRLATRIAALLPQHTLYAEPFCGGAAVMFKKPWPTKASNEGVSYAEVLNDTNLAAVSFWRTLRDPVLGPKLVDRCKLTPHSIDEYHSAREVLFSEPGSVPAEDLAWALFACANTSFGGITTGGWGRDKFRGKGRTFLEASIRLLSYVERMAGVMVDNVDAIKFIRHWDSPHAVFYCDPPYPGTAQGMYGGYTQRDFENLITTLDQCQGSFLLSSYPNEAVPDSWEKFEFPRKRQLAKSEVSAAHTETVWRRFNTVPAGKWAQKLYDHEDFDCFIPRPEGLPYANT